MPAAELMFLFNSMMLSSILRVVVLTTTCVPVTVRVPDTVNLGMDTDAVAPSMLMAVVSATPPCLMLKLMSPLFTVLVMVRSLLAWVMVLLLAVPMATPLTKVINPAAVSVVSDLKKLSDNTIVVLSSSNNPVAVVATPRNLLLLIDVDRVMPL